MWPSIYGVAAEHGIAAERIKPWNEPDIAAGFAVAQRGAQCSPGFGAAAIILDRFFHMRPQLSVDFAAQPVTAKCVSYARPKRHVTPSSAHCAPQKSLFASAIPPWRAACHLLQSVDRHVPPSLVLRDPCGGLRDSIFSTSRSSDLRTVTEAVSSRPSAWRKAATQGCSPDLGRAGCISRKVNPRVRPPVYGVKYGRHGSNIA